MGQMVQNIVSLLALSFFAFTSSADSSLRPLNLEQIYSLPMSQIEASVYAQDQEMCEGSMSTYQQGVDDPAGLNKAEFCAVQIYSGSGFEINRYLWTTPSDGSHLDGMQWAFVRLLDQALSKIKSQPQTVVYSGTTRRHMSFTQPGQVIRFKGYTSTTEDRFVAEGFVIDRLLVMTIVNGKDIMGYSNAGMERELLLPRSSYLRFDRSEMVEMEIFTESGPEVRQVEVVYLTEVQRP
jgi:hypothetical protein